MEIDRASALERANQIAAAVAKRSVTPAMVGSLVADMAESVEFVAENSVTSSITTTASGSANALKLSEELTALGERGGGRLDIGPGTYPLDSSDASPLVIPDAVFIRGAGMFATALNFSNKSTFNYTSGIFVAEGAGRSNSVSVTANVAMGALQCSVSSISGFNPGDMVQLRSTENYVTDGGTRAEFLKVRYTTGTTVVFTTPTQEVYDIGLGTVTLAKVTFTTGGISDLAIFGKGINPLGQPTPDPYTSAPNEASAASERGDYGIELRWARDFWIERVRMVGVENIGILPQSCFGGGVRQCRIDFDPIRELLQYGVAPFGCTANYSVDDNVIVNGRHGFTTLSSSGTSIDYRFGVPDNISVRGNKAFGSWVSGIDTHAGGHRILLENNHVQGNAIGILIRSDRVTCRGNHIYGPIGAAVTSGNDGIQVRGSNVILEGNLIHGFDCGVRVANLTANTTNLLVQGNRITSSFSHGVRITTGATYSVTQIKVLGNLVSSFTDYGVYFDGAKSLNDVIVEGNQFVNGTRGIMTAGAGLKQQWTISGNNFRLQSEEAFYLEAVEDFVVSGNTVNGSATNGTQSRTRDCLRGVVSGNLVRFPSGSTGGIGIWINCTGSGLSSDINVTGNTVTAPTSIGTGIYLEDQANQYHFVSGNHCRTCATPVRSTTDVTTRDLDNVSQSITIASGAVSVRSGVKRLVIDTEGGAGTDDLDTITYAGTPGDLITITSSNDAREPTVKDGTGNIFLGGDFLLSANTDTLTLQWNGSSWREVARSDNNA